MKGQAAEAMPEIVKMAADVMFPKLKTEDRVKELFKMMEEGELDPNVLLPKLAARMTEISEPMMEQYWKSLTFARKNLAKTAESLFMKFMGAGGEKGLTTILTSIENLFAASSFNIGEYGKAFENLSYGISDSILTIRDFIDYVNMAENSSNVFFKTLGSSSTSNLVSGINSVIKGVRELTYEFAELGKQIVIALGPTIIASIEAIGWTMQRMAEGLRLMTAALMAFNKGLDPGEAVYIEAQRMAKEQNLIASINKEREKQGLRPLTPSEEASAISQLPPKPQAGEANAVVKFLSKGGVLGIANDFIFGDKKDKNQQGTPTATPTNPPTGVNWRQGVFGTTGVPSQNPPQLPQFTTVNNIPPTGTEEEKTAYAMKVFGANNDPTLSMLKQLLDRNLTVETVHRHKLDGNIEIKGIALTPEQEVELGEWIIRRYAGTTTVQNVIQ